MSSATVNDSTAPQYTMSDENVPDPTVQTRTGGDVVDTYPAISSTSDVHGSTTDGDENPDSGGAPGYVCTDWKASTWHYDKREAFTHMWAWSGAHGTVHETIKTSHKLGIAASFDSGQFKATGGSSATATNSSDLARTWSTNVSVANEVNYRTFNRDCGSAPSYQMTDHYHQIRPVQVTFLMPDEAIKSIDYNYFYTCRRYSSGVPKRVTGVQVTFSRGVDLGPFSLSSQSGYNNNTAVAWNVTQTSDICGSDSGGFGSAAEVAVRNPYQPDCRTGICW